MSIAVGTVIADRPPHRSVRAELLHTALTGNGNRKGNHFGSRKGNQIGNRKGNHLMQNTSLVG
jgi:hypothetical protein